jgi:uncharacterized membrane protein
MVQITIETVNRLREKFAEGAISAEEYRRKLDLIIGLAKIELN